MPEGRSYRCKWEHTKHGYRVWVAKRPRLSADGASLDEALTNLSGMICEQTGDGEAALSLIPLPPPETWDAPWVQPHLALLSGDGEVQLADDGAEYFTGGFCPKCYLPRGVRTEVPLLATHAGVQDVAAPWWKHGMKGLNYDPILVSERFLDVLTNEEHTRCAWRKLGMPKHCRTHYYECIPRAMIEPVAVKNWTAEGWRCPTCDRTCFSCTPQRRLSWQDNTIRNWFSLRAIKRAKPMSGCGEHSSFYLLLPLERAVSIVDHRHASGIRLHMVAAVPDQMIEPQPKLKAR